MIGRLTAAGGLLTLLLTLGCGNKGPLYLPPPDTGPPPPAVEQPAER